MRSIWGLAATSAAVLGLASGAQAAGEPTMLHISSHLARAAKASLDGAAPVRAPGYGSTNVPIGAGQHVLKITPATGAAYTTPLNLDPAKLMHWHGKGYWCVNFLATSLDVYSTEDCEEEVTDAG